MPTCQHCGKEWSWKQTIKTSFTLGTVLTCPHCEHQQFITKQSRWRMNVLNFIIPLNLLLPLLFDIPPVVTLFSLFGTGALIILIHPFFVQLSNTEDPLW